MAPPILSHVGDGSYLAALLLFLPLAFVWNLLRRRKPVSVASAGRQSEPRLLPLHFGVKDYAKALLAWIFLFMRTFSVRPGVYYLGRWDEDAPLLVTGNCYLTVFLLTRRLKTRNVRLLVIDTKGINVWCAAGKGQFSAQEIVAKARAGGVLKPESRTRMVLPKFSLSGVNLNELRNQGIMPIIGPLYAKDVPAFLQQGKLTNQTTDTVHFGLRARAFTALPTAVQFFYYFLGVYVLSLGFIAPAAIWITAGLAFIYPILFPWLPGRLFSVKGLSLALLASVLNIIIHFGNVQEQVLLTTFFFATSVFIALSYTGNSAVSNYTSVRKETARFLPVVVLLYLALLPIKLLM